MEKLKKIWKMYNEIDNDCRDMLKEMDDKSAYEICMDIESAYTFLRMLIRIFPDQNLICKFGGTIVYYAVAGNPTHIMYAQLVLQCLPIQWIEQSLYGLVESSLSIETNANDDYVLRRSAELLYMFHQHDNLKVFLDRYCVESKNEDIKEIYEDYSE